VSTVQERTDRRLSTMTPRRSDARLTREQDRSLPPGPRWPAAVQTVALLRFRHQFVPWLHRTYGDVITIRLLPGAQPLVLFTRPEHAREIFAGDPEVFHAGKANAILGPVMGEHSLLLVDGAQHKRARRLLMPAFNGHAIKTYAGLVAEVTRDHLTRWRDGEELRSLDAMNALTLDVIFRVVFGITDETRLAQLRPRVNATVDINPGWLFAWTIPRLRGLRRLREVRDNQAELDALIYAEIAERRAAPDLDQRTDVLSTLIRVDDDGDRLGDDELRDQLVTLLLAGHETTATALAWALYELGRDQALLRRTQAAAREGDDEWLEAVLKESMRLHPVIPMVVRTLQRPTTVCGYDFPAGVTVGPSIILSHARADNHPDPEAFRPDRFVGGSPAINTWIPFGGGVRRCIGAGFSLMEGVEVLRQVCADWDVETVAPDRPKVRNITSVPRGGARIRVTRA